MIKRPSDTTSGNQSFEQEESRDAATAKSTKAETTPTRAKVLKDASDFKDAEAEALEANESKPIDAEAAKANLGKPASGCKAVKP